MILTHLFPQLPAVTPQTRSVSFHKSLGVPDAMRQELENVSMYGNDRNNITGAHWPGN